MKTLILGALALTLAVPAMAQPAQAQDHQGHQMPAQGAALAQQHGMAQQGGQGGRAMDHSQMADCCGDANSSRKMDCCENMAANGGRDCCAEHAQRQQPAPTQPSNR